ncbi:MBL fold metallo-hydrolase [Clostridium fungisolvens]|uniref:Putative metallo-hydrolase YflN n=1 Tax=Clostridium fungisolvens TaxID=1604897 RepID=A0A6V8SBS3_9CLOT|nr:MBL fold metallo-hydrolase [Clostridium fungisolvens]GFP74667.1 putative metallo-hydrolase YflN [Clostridium fungisolvens]
MNIAEGLSVLELGNKEHQMHPTLIFDEDDVVLIDAGLPGQFENVSEEIVKAGVSVDRIDKIIITHHDIDHIGGLASVVKNSKSEVEVLSHAGEKSYIEGDKMPVKMTPERLNSMPEDKRNETLEMLKKLKVKVSRTIEDGEVLPYCGGIEVIYTPGHTPGHTCLYLKKYKTLVTGDALNVFDGKLTGPNPVFTFDMKQATESLKKLSKYDIQTVICYHGGVFTDNPNERIAEIANREII